MLAAGAAVFGPARTLAQAQPVVKVGPYRVAVDRITQNRSVVLDYKTGQQQSGGVRTQRTVQVQVAVHSDVPGAREGLTTFQIKSVLMEKNGRPVELPHYGGPLETPNDPALVRAYLYVPSLPASVAEIRTIDGEIVSYERSAPLEVEFPLEGALPRTIEKDGVKVTLREWAQDGPSARAVLWVEAPAGGLIVNTATDGSNGLTLLNTQGRPALVGVGSMLQVRAHQAEFRMAYNSVQGTAAKIRLRFLHRAGPRRVWPFRLEHIPIAPRPGN